MDYQSPRGTQDILPEEQSYWEYVRDRATDAAKRYGYGRIDTPVFEDARLFSRTIGQDTDIVSKEMYTFVDRGGNELTLRPEGTAPVCRAYIQHGMSSRPRPVKLFYLADIFRYDRPQAGRYRQHHQFGFEIIGDADAAADAEVIELAWHFYRELGLTTLPVQLNSIGCPECRGGYITALKNYYAPEIEHQCQDCRSRFQNNPLRLLDCKRPGCLNRAPGAPSAIEYLCTDCQAHFERLTGLLKSVDIPYETNKCLVRGLDYYRRTVFEIQPVEEGAQSTIGGGGRYDGLIEQLGGESTPAVGFATGIERIILNLKRQNVPVPTTTAPQFFLAWLGEASSHMAFGLAAELRGKGFRLVQSLSSRSLKAQLRQASSLGVSYCLIIGETEMANGSVILRDMAGSGQRTIQLQQLIPELNSLV